MSATPIAFAFQVQGDAEAKQKIQSVGGAFQNFGRQAEVVNKQVEPIQRNFQQAALGMAGAATATAGLIFSFQNLEKAQLAVARAEKEVVDNQATVAGAQLTLNRMVAQGKEGTEEYETAVLRLDAAQRNYAIAQENLTLVQRDQSNATTQFALSILPTTIGAVSSASMAIKGLGLSFGATGASAGVASGGVTLFGRSLKLASLAPPLLAFTAIATVLTLIATNAFGVRDAIDSFAKKVEEVFPVLKPVFDFFRDIAKTLFPEAEQSADDMELGMNNAFQQVGEGAKELNMGVSNEIEILASTFDEKADSITSDANRIKKAMSTIGISGSDITKSLAEQFAESMETTPPAVAPAVTTPPGTADLDSRIAAIVEQLTGVSMKDGKIVSRGLGGGLSLDRLREMGFQNIPSNEIGQLLRELESLEAEKAEIEKAALAAKFTTPSSPLSGKSFAELVAQGKKQQDRLFFSNNLFPSQMSTEAFMANERARDIERQVEPFISFMNSVPFAVDPATMPGMFGDTNVTIQGGDVYLDGEIVGKIQDKKFKLTLGATT